MKKQSSLSEHIHLAEDLSVVRIPIGGFNGSLNISEYLVARPKSKFNSANNSTNRIRNNSSQSGPRILNTNTSTHPTKSNYANNEDGKPKSN